MEYIKNADRWQSADDRRNDLLTVIINILTKRLSALEEHALGLGEMLNSTINLLTSTNNSILKLTDRLKENNKVEDKVCKLTEQVLAVSEILRAVAIEVKGIKP